MRTSGIVGRKLLGLWMVGLGAALWAPGHARALEPFPIGDKVEVLPSDTFWPERIVGGGAGFVATLRESGNVNNDSCTTRVDGEGRALDVPPDCQYADEALRFDGQHYRRFA